MEATTTTAIVIDGYTISRTVSARYGLARLNGSSVPLNYLANFSVRGRGRQWALLTRFHNGFGRRFNDLYGRNTGLRCVPWIDLDGFDNLG